jgi:hypothetical protein
MLAFFKRIFADKCPTCGETLICEGEPLSCVKTCLNGHYKEETYCSLGVRIIYDLK